MAGGFTEAGQILKGKRASLPFAPNPITWRNCCTANLLSLNGVYHDAQSGPRLWRQLRLACVRVPSWVRDKERQVRTGDPSRLLTRTRLLTAACTAATGIVRSGIAFPSTSPSSCMITRWDICWATGSRILSMVFVWNTGMVTALKSYPRERPSNSPTASPKDLLRYRYHSPGRPPFFRDSFTLSAGRLELLP